MAVRSARIGYVWDDAWEGVEDVAEGLVDVATSAVDALSDAGEEIGSVLKAIAPIVALVPGWGTALSVALSAAGSWAAQDAIDDAVIGIASSAMPNPVARSAFDAAAEITQATLNGGDVAGAAIGACRRAAGAVGGDRAAAAFDVGLQVARGQPINDSAWALARQQAASSGTASLAAFDAAVAVKNGGDATDVVLAAARAYLEQAGGAPALVAFDVGVALGQGKALQDAGFSALKNFVRGNDAASRALVFAEKMAKAAREGKSLARVLAEELISDVGRYGVARAAGELGNILDGWRPEFSEWGVDSLAARFGVSALMAQAAQAVMRTGEPDAELYAKLTQTGVEQAIAKFGERFVASRELNASYADVRSEQRAEALEVLIRLPSDSLSYAAAKAEAPVRAGARVRVSAGSTNFPEPAPDELLELLEVVAEAPAPVVKPRTGVVGNVALGVTVGAACLALVWWARSS